MALDMADSYASSATVRVLVSFYLVLTDNTSTSSARTSAIHKEKFNVALSGKEHNEAFNVVKHLKTFIGLAKVAKNKSLGEIPEVTICHIMLFHYTEIQKAHYL